MSFISSPSAFRNAASWAALPLASSLPDGTVYRVEGFGAMGFSFWVVSGSIWRPFNGYVRAFQAMTSDIASPLATVTAATTKFALPAGDLLIPAGMLQDGFMLDLRAWISRAVTGTTCSFRATLNTTNGITFSGFCDFQISAANSDARAAAGISFAADTSQGVRDGSFTGWNSATVATSIANVATLVNTNVDMYVSMGSSSSFGAGDTLRLHGYEIVVRG